MARVNFEVEKVGAALAVINDLNGKTTVDTGPARECSEMFAALANGSFDQLTPTDHSRLRRAATAIGRSYRSDHALKALLLELSNDLKLVGCTKMEERRRVKVFCQNAVDYRS
jgi:hypothetical protein